MGGRARAYYDGPNECAWCVSCENNPSSHTACVSFKDLLFTDSILSDTVYTQTMDIEIPSEVHDVKRNDETRDGKEGQQDGMTGERVGLDGEGSASGEKQEMKMDQKPKVKMSDKYNEDDADLTIISSDSVAFKVHSIVISRVSYGEFPYISS